MTVLRCDQADTLRAWARERACGQAHLGPEAKAAQVIAVASGKGGVGKSSLVANLAVAFAREGRRVLALDGDLGLANLDLILGVTPRHTVLDVVHGNARIADALVEGPAGVVVLPACAGRFDLANLAEHAQYGLFSTIDTLENRFDLLLIDTPSGLGANAVAFAGAAQQVVLVVTPDPTSLSDAYAFAKVLRGRCGVKRLQLVANMVSGVAEGEALYARLGSLLERFLGVSLDYLGPISQDYRAARAIRAAVPLLLHAPTSPAAQCMGAIARRLDQLPEPQSGGIRLFWRRLLARSADA